MEINLPTCTCQRGDYVCPRNEALKKLQAEVKELGFVSLGAGCSREAFKHPFYDWVIKIPRNCVYMLANVIEYRVAQKGKFPAPAMHLEVVHDLPVIHMERVTLPDSWEQKNKWALTNPWMHDLYDGQQVGKAKDGRVLVYDLGHEDGWGEFERDPGRVR